MRVMRVERLPCCSGGVTPKPHNIDWVGSMIREDTRETEKAKVRKILEFVSFVYS